MVVKKKLGIIGGMGARAGASFLQAVIAHSPAVTDQDFIEIILHNNSAIPDRSRHILHNEPSPLPELHRSLQVLNDNAVQVIALACITSYFYFDQLIPHTRALILHPVRLAADAIVEHHPHIKKIGLLATSGTIRSGLFHTELRARGLEVVTLPPAAQEDLFMRSVYMPNGLKSATISEKARHLFLQTIPLLEEAGAELILAGCSEVPLALNQQLVRLPYLDTLDLLAREAVYSCYGTAAPELKDTTAFPDILYSF